MNKQKIMEFVKSKVGACIISGIVGLSIGIAGGADVEPLENTIAENQTTIESQAKEIESKTAEIEQLTTKVDEAAPFFAMKAEEQAQLEAQAKKEREEREAQAKKEKEERDAAEQAEAEAKVKEAEAKAKAELEARTKELSNGNFVAGTDFDAGTYDLIATSGGGNVSSSNMYSGGINAIMGTADDGFYQKEYKNIKLPYGTELRIKGVTIKIVPKA